MNNRDERPEHIDSHLLTHESIYLLLDAYFTHEVSADINRIVESHLQICATCKQRLADIDYFHQLFERVSNNPVTSSSSLNVEQTTHPESLADAVLNGIVQAEKKDHSPLVGENSTFPPASSSPLFHQSGVLHIGIHAQLDGKQQGRQDTFDQKLSDGSNTNQRGEINMNKRVPGEFYEPEALHQQNEARTFAARLSRPHRWLTLTVVLVAALVLVLASTFVTQLLSMQQHSHRIGGLVHSTATTHPTIATTPSPVLQEGWVRQWALPPLAEDTDPSKPNFLPSLTWSPAAPRTFYLCRAQLDYQTSALPAVLTDFYRSEDAGVHWTALPLPEAASSCLLLPDMARPNIIGLEDDRGGNYISTDRGQHWQRLQPPPGWYEGNGPSFHMSLVSGRLYVGGYWTSDYHHWTRWYPDKQASSYFQQLAVNPQHPDTMYTVVDTCNGTPSLPAGVQSLCRSDDGGQSWHFLIAFHSVTTDPLTPMLCLAASNPSVLYTIGNTTQGAQPLRSTDGGKTWQPISPSIGGSFTSLWAGVCGAAFFEGEQSTTVDDTRFDFPFFAKTDTGTIYHASYSQETVGGIEIPQGVSILVNKTWKQIASVPFAQNTLPPYNLKILFSPSSASSPPLLLAFDHLYIYRYTGSIGA